MPGVILAWESPKVILMKILLMCSLVFYLGYLLVACAATPSSSKPILVDQSMDSGLVELSVGQTLEIVLPGNPTTGYEWTLKGVDKSVLEQVGDLEYQSESDAVGGGGVFHLEMRAVAPGETSLEMEYRRPFEPGDTPPADQFTILVKVR